MASKLILTSKDLLDKQFKFVDEGYNPLDVDEFLDQVINDYKIIENHVLVKDEELKVLDKRIKTLSLQCDELKTKLAKYEKRFEGIKEDVRVTKDNIDYIQRISKLEDALWKHGVDPSKIK